MKGSRLKVKAGGKQPVRLRRLRRRRRPATLIEKPSQKRASQRKLERQRSWQSQGMRQKARARKSATGDPEVQRTVDGGYSSAAQLTMQGPAEVESSPQACERDRVATSCAIQTASPENQHATRFRVARQLSQGAGVRRKPGDQPRLDWRTQGTEVEGSRQPAQAGDAAAAESRELVASLAEGFEHRA